MPTEATSSAARAPTTLRDPPLAGVVPVGVLPTVPVALYVPVGACAKVAVVVIAPEMPELLSVGATKLQKESQLSPRWNALVIDSMKLNSPPLEGQRVVLPVGRLGASAIDGNGERDEGFEVLRGVDGEQAVRINDER